MTTSSGALATPLGIPLIYGVDAVHGHNNVVGATIFPHDIGLGATRDPALLQQIGRAVATEVSGTGIDWNFAPCLCVARDDQGNTQLTEAQLRAIHLPPFRAAIEQHNVGSIMISFSGWNGQKLHGHDYLIMTLLKGELGFGGFVVSDWNGIDQIDGRSGFTAAEVTDAINASIDMMMVPQAWRTFLTTLRGEVQAGRITMLLKNTGGLLPLAKDESRSLWRARARTTSGTRAEAGPLAGGAPPTASPREPRSCKASGPRPGRRRRSPRASAARASTRRTVRRSRWWWGRRRRPRARAIGRAASRWIGRTCAPSKLCGVRGTP
ncbi:MAG TPA: glycoside hydrolase family 3 N-terminal domain-containing protein [Candidatus Limnocylindrales bacterium]